MMNKEQKKNYISEMATKFENSKAVMVTHYQGLTMTQLDDLMRYVEQLNSYDIPNASKNARWSAFDPVGTKLIDKTEQATWDMTSWDNDDAPWDKATLDPSEQAIFIRAGSISNFNLYNTTYAKPGYVTPQSGTTGYFSEE